MAASAKQQSNVPARVPKTGINDLRRLLEQYKGQIAMALPKHVTPERMIRVALTAFSRTPLLAECSATSICGALVSASILGLEPDGMSGEAFLIPYWSTKAGGYECQMQPGYKGIVKLARNTGEIQQIDAQPVRENDVFKMQKGTGAFLLHEVDIRKNRGPIIGYWAGYELKDGGRNYEYMSVSEIEAHRDQYSQGAYKKSRGQFVLDDNQQKILTGPWKDSPDWMYRKTVLMQSLKLAPKSYQLRTAMTLSDTADAGVAQTFVDLPKELNPVPMDEPNDESTPRIAEPQAKADPAKPAAAAKDALQSVILISDTQARRLEQIAEEQGWRSLDVLGWLTKEYKIGSVSDIKAVDYDHIIEIIRAGGEVPA
jgi:recombination protein RecT